MPLSREECLQLNRVNLDAGCGPRKQLGFIGMDRREGPGVDIVHDLEKFPWPLADESCNLVLMSHVLEHLDPRITIELFDEIWRVLRPSGSVLVTGPYAFSAGAYQDPTHTRLGHTEKCFWYFDPVLAPDLYNLYKPKPFKYREDVSTYRIGYDFHVVLEKRLRANEDEPQSVRVA